MFHFDYLSNKNLEYFFKKGISFNGKNDLVNG